MTSSEALNIVKEILPNSHIERGIMTFVYYNDYVIVPDYKILYIRKKTSNSIIIALASIYLDNIDNELLTSIIKTLV